MQNLSKTNGALNKEVAKSAGSFSVQKKVDADETSERQWRRPNYHRGGREETRRADKAEFSKAIKSATAVKAAGPD